MSEVTFQGSGWFDSVHGVLFQSRWANVKRFHQTLPLYDFTAQGYISAHAILTKTFQIILFHAQELTEGQGNLTGYENYTLTYNQTT